MCDMYAQVHIHAFVFMYICAPVPILCICAYAYTCVQAYLPVCICMRTYLCVCANHIFMNERKPTSLASMTSTEAGGEMLCGSGSLSVPALSVHAGKGEGI